MADQLPIRPGYGTPLERAQKVTDVQDDNRMMDNTLRRAFRDARRRAQRTGRPEDSLLAANILAKGQDMGFDLSGVRKFGQANATAANQLAQFQQEQSGVQQIATDNLMGATGAPTPPVNPANGTGLPNSSAGNVEITGGMNGGAMDGVNSSQPLQPILPKSLESTMDVNPNQPNLPEFPGITPLAPGSRPAGIYMGKPGSSEMTRVGSPAQRPAGIYFRDTAIGPEQYRPVKPSSVTPTLSVLTKQEGGKSVPVGADMESRIDEALRWSYEKKKTFPPKEDREVNLLDFIKQRQRAATR